MKRIPEFEIMQNTTLGAFAIHSFVREYYAQKEKIMGIPLHYLMPVLPIVFNSDSALKISSKQRRITSFYKAIAEEKFIPIGLQFKMEEMYRQTIDSINIAMALGMILYSSEESSFFPKEKIRLPDLIAEDNNNIIRAAGNLGFWFAEISIEELCVSLKINY